MHFLTQELWKVTPGLCSSFGNWNQGRFSRPSCLAEGRLCRSYANRSGMVVSFYHKVCGLHVGETFPGAEILITVGGVMAMFPIFYAVIENDLRRVLCYSKINQIGFGGVLGWDRIGH